MTPDSPPSDDLTGTQARIVQAALELFAEHSYEAATTQAIARRAGVTERTLFRHF
ncbi:MAG TPA: helix-turn-helix domain-containing protein, partial [Oscillatoriaceae cyanobacterium]